MKFPRATYHICAFRYKQDAEMFYHEMQKRLRKFNLELSSELDESDDRIIEMYRGLWRIEESFKITKSNLNARPIFLTRKDHTNAHFLICFISLVIARIVELRLENKYSIEKYLIQYALYLVVI